MEDDQAEGGDRDMIDASAVGEARFRRLDTIDFGDIGLGDNLMAWAGLHALLSHGLRPVAAGCRLYVPAELAALAAALFKPYGIRVEAVVPFSLRPRPGAVFTPSPPKTIWSALRTYVGPDWRMNCFNALDAQLVLDGFDAPLKFRERLWLELSERIFYRRGGWRAAVPEYVGYRLWRPVARRLGLLPLPFLSLMKLSLKALRADFVRYVERSVAPATPPRFAIFPAGKAFQAFPAQVCRNIQAQLPKGEAVFFVPPDDPWIDQYRDAGVNLGRLASLDQLLGVLFGAPSVLTTDSFSSHAAQFLRDDFVLALTRDFRENVVHPGAHPAMVANHPACSPCRYLTRSTSSSCAAGRSTCEAYDDESFGVALAAALAAGGQR
jgi:hypothetical protein